MFEGRRIDLGQLLRAQIQVIDTQARDLAEARGHLETALSRIDRGEPLDAATLYSLIKSGETIMEHENWSAVSDRYIGPDAKADFAAAVPKMSTDFDHAAYTAKRDDLAARIEAALPMDPKSNQARAFYEEWQADQKPPFSAEVWAFIKSVGPAPKTGS